MVSCWGSPRGSVNGHTCCCLPAQSCHRPLLCSRSVLSPTALLILCPSLIIGCGSLSHSGVKQPVSSLESNYRFYSKWSRYAAQDQRRVQWEWVEALPSSHFLRCLINERWHWTPRADVKLGGCGDLQIKVGDWHRQQVTRSHCESRLRRCLWLLGFYMPS